MSKLTKSNLYYLEHNNTHTERPKTTYKSISIIDFINYPYKTTKITSPRSLNAINQLNYSVSELYQISFDNFKTKYPEVIALSPELLKKRYHFIEKNRQNKIEQIKELREALSNDPYSHCNNINSHHELKHSFSKVNITNNQITANNQYNEFNHTTGFNIDRKQYAKLKAKREMNLMNQVQYEIQKEIMHQRITEKQKKAIEKAEREQLSIRKQNEITKRNNIQKEQDKHRRLEEEEKLKQHQERLRFESEQRKQIEEKEKETKRLRELSKKKEENDLKIHIVQDRFNHLNEETNQMLEEVKRMADFKDRERQKKLEEIKMVKMKERIIRDRKKREMIERNNIQLEKELNGIKLLYYEKQAQNEEKKIKYEEKIKQLNEEKQLKTKQKAEEIQKTIEKNKKIEQARIEQYLIKQQELLIKADEIEKALLRQQTERKKLNSKREIVASRIFREKEKESSKKKEELVNKMEMRNRRINEKKQYKHIKMIQEIEEKNQFHIYKQEIIQRIARKDNDKRNKLYADILYKNSKVNEYFEQKKLLAEEKQIINANISKEKKDKENRFNSVLEKKTFDHKAIYTINKLFPFNSEINQLVKEIKVKPQTIKRRYLFNSQAGSMANLNMKNKDMLVENNQDQYMSSKANKMVWHSQDNTTNAKCNYINNDSSYDTKTNCTLKKEKKEKEKRQCLSEEEIIEEVNKYKISLNQELLQLLADERDKEEQRERALKQLKNQSEIDSLERRYGIARAQASKTIFIKSE